eukprot:Nitzschia sp. Nitz4//scaffold31_size150131//90099//91653//NITZ4_002838-RA/size150131-augustus-gene-0.5-mRNA-1//1//CDS//3329547689//6710//frame0
MATTATATATATTSASVAEAIPSSDDASLQSKNTGVTLADVIHAFEQEGKHKVLPPNEETEDSDYHIPSSQMTLSSQVTLSQTDEAISKLDKEGALNQVIGSQSMLSQEIMMSSQQEDEEPSQSFQLSQQTETSTAMAQRLGLLTQDDDERLLDAARKAAVVPSPEDNAVSPAPTSTASTTVTSASNSVVQPPPLRESECFGSLLDAVERITKEEELNAKLLAWQASGAADETEESKASSTTSTKSRKRSHRPLPTSNRDTGALSSLSTTLASPSSPPRKSRKTDSTDRKEQDQRKAQETAKRAAALAEQTITDPEMAKQLLLSMALMRENPRSVPSVLPPPGSTVPEGFFWAHYPPLEAVLKEHMAEYYELSTTKCQSSQQQTFNNDLVVLVRGVAKKEGWKFHSSFGDKALRDRIRCYYKTHIQNAKKRLRTMVRNPTKRANARHLCAHLDLIEQHKASGKKRTSPPARRDYQDSETETEDEQDYSE